MVLVKHEMVVAFEAGIKQYQPTGWIGDAWIELEMETGNPAVTARNLHQIVTSSPKRSILAVISRGVPDSAVLIVFKTGETYLATGFKLGSPELTRFLVEHNDGDWTEDLDEMQRFLASWPRDMAGPVFIPPQN